jgi:dynein heavy chain 2
VGSLKTSFQQRIGEAEALKLQLGRAEATLAAATSLLGKLSGEKSRWQGQVGSGACFRVLASLRCMHQPPCLPACARHTQPPGSPQVKSLQQELQQLPLHALLAAAFCTYLPAQPEARRERQMAAW